LKNISFKIPDEEHATWQTAAYDSRMSLSEWIRTTLASALPCEESPASVNVILTDREKKSGVLRTLVEQGTVVRGSALRQIPPWAADDTIPISIAREKLFGTNPNRRRSPLEVQFGMLAVLSFQAFREDGRPAYDQYENPIIYD
jgi:hypothetical protein